MEKKKEKITKKKKNDGRIFFYGNIAYFLITF